MSSLFDSGIRPSIDKWLLDKSKETRDYGQYWSASSGGYCMRRVIFERLSVPKIESESDARKQRVFTSGHLFHEWIQGITKEAGLSIAQELELQDEDLMIRGHIDDLVLIETEGESFGPLADNMDMPGMPPTQHLILYDYKTVNSRSFMWAKKNDNAMSYYHRMQLGTYMYMLKKRPDKYIVSPDVPTVGLTEARILKIEKDTLMMNEQQLIWDESLAVEVVAYWRVLNRYWNAKKIPPCTCADYEGGFLAKEQYNGYFYEGEPCSLKYYKEWKEKQRETL